MVIMVMIAIGTMHVLVFDFFVFVHRHRFEVLARMSHRVREAWRVCEVGSRRSGAKAIAVAMA